MQTLAKYLIERPEEGSSEREADRQRILNVLRAWLSKKGADDPASTSGEFASKTRDATGEYRWQHAEDGELSWDLLRLEEADPDRRIFVVQASVTKSEDRVLFYVTLSVGVAHSAVIPYSVDPRCPHVVRDVLALSGDWYHGSTKFLQARRLTGTESGGWLADEILNEQRTFPIIVVSEVDDEVILPGLQDRLAYETAGLANVFTVDDAASWALTERLSKERSCYLGAVRLYWPPLEEAFDSFVWTASRLLSQPGSHHQIRDAFSAQLRRRLMRAAAVSVERPRVVDSVRAAPVRRRIDELQSRAESIEQYKELFELAAAENAELKTEKEELEQELFDLRSRVKSLELRSRTSEKDDIPPDDDAPGPPEAGEIRYYKKVGSTKKRDVMARRKDCGHNVWQGVRQGDKAKKGIKNLEGTAEWKNLWHCGTCTGGGVWRVKW